MTLINCKDGTSEYITNYRDIIDLVKEKISYDLGSMMENDYNFDVFNSEIFNI